MMERPPFNAAEALTAADLIPSWSASVQNEGAGAGLPLPAAYEERGGASSKAPPTADQAALLAGRTKGERRLWPRLLAPDDVADMLLEVSPEDQGELLWLAR